MMMKYIGKVAAYLRTNQESGLVHTATLIALTPSRYIYYRYMHHYAWRVKSSNEGQEDHSQPIGHPS